MKCQKCGFVSFDYLSQCKKCGADLTATREKMGFSALKSEVPFLLGALLVGGGKSDISKAMAGEGTVDVDFGYDSAPSWSEDVNLERAAEKGATAPGENIGPWETEKDELIIELSEDDLEDLPGIEES